MAPSRRILGRAALGAYRAWARIGTKAFSTFAGGAFATFGPGSTIVPPLRVVGERRIAIGQGVFLGAGCWLHVLDEDAPGIALEIGDGCEIAGNCVFSAVERVRLGRGVLFARNVYVSDHIHAYDDPDVPVLEQGVARVVPVEIGDGAWLGQNVVVCPGVTIGRGAVIGANSVVVSDVPEYALAVGAPARIVRRFAGADETLEERTA